VNWLKCLTKNKNVKKSILHFYTITSHKFPSQQQRVLTGFCLTFQWYSSKRVLGNCFGCDRHTNILVNF